MESDTIKEDSVPDRLVNVVEGEEIVKENWGATILFIIIVVTVLILLYLRGTFT